MTSEREKLEGMFETWEAIAGHDEAIDWLFTLATKLDRENYDLKRQLSTAKR